MRFRAGDVLIHSFKEGLLARMAHDLRLRVTDFEVTVTDDKVVAVLKPRSIEVSGVMARGGLDPNALSSSDKAKILQNLHQEVLHTDRFAEIRYEGTHRELSPGNFQLEGALTLRGKPVAQPISIRLKDGTFSGEVMVQPSRWGITPYSAFAGALRVQDRVEIRFALRPDPAA